MIGTGIRAALMAALILWSAAASAQETVWLQIEARPDRISAEDRAAAWAGRFDNVTGFQLRSGWYAIALGPYAAEIAEDELFRLRSGGAIPSDSFVAEPRAFLDQFWPPAGQRDSLVLTLPGPAPEPPVPADETPAQARAAERLLTRAEREAVQEALLAFGFYTARIDGDFGPGTRRAMARWQAAQGYEETGILTTAQRRELRETLDVIRGSLGMARVVDGPAGIEIDLPLDEVAFAEYRAPFARYEGEDATVLLISQSGDRDTLAALYEVMQTLEIVPLEGPRQLSRTGFRLTGIDDEIVSTTVARLEDGAVKGFTLIWPAGDDLRRGILLARMETSFRAMPDRVLPDTAGAGQSPDLMAGLAIRQPEVTASGFYVDNSGAILTSGVPVASCARITVDGDFEAEVAARDATGMLALLRPVVRAVPLASGRLSAAPARLGSDIAVSGYSYGGRLGGSTMSFGTLEDLRGLGGAENVLRLSLAALPGDVGGPVLDESGGVLGLLLPRLKSERAVPKDVQLAADAGTLAAFLAEQGIDPVTAEATDALDPVDLAGLAADMTALVECWN